jgi:hypothetical protein
MCMHASIGCPRALPNLVVRHLLWVSFIYSLGLDEKCIKKRLMLVRSPLRIRLLRTWTSAGLTVSLTMATQTESFTKVRNSFGNIRTPFTNHPNKVTPSQASTYHIEERQTIRTLVPFDSPLSVVVHLVNWTCWTLYFILRLRGIYGSSDLWLWTVYLCEVAFVCQDLQTAFDLSLSLFGPRKNFEHKQYILTGPQAPKVDVLVTLGYFFPSSLILLTPSGYAEKIYRQ